MAMADVLIEAKHVALFTPEIGSPLTVTDKTIVRVAFIGLTIDAKAPIPTIGAISHLKEEETSPLGHRDEDYAVQLYETMEKGRHMVSRVTVSRITMSAGDKAVIEVTFVCQLTSVRKAKTGAPDSYDYLISINIT